MKKIILFLLLFSSLAFSQTWRSQSVSIDSADYSTDAFKIPEGFGLKSIVFPALTATTTSFKLLAGISSSSLDTLWYDDVEFSQTIDVDGCPVSLNANVVYGYQWFKVLFSVQQTADATLTIISIKQN